MENEPIKLKDFEEAPRRTIFSEKRLLNNNNIIHDNDYLTFNNIESSLVINENTSQFDLYKGFFFVFISCLFKTLFSLLCKILLGRNKAITSFHLLAYKVYIMFGITIILCIFIIYTYYINSVGVNYKNFKKIKNGECSEKNVNMTNSKIKNEAQISINIISDKNSEKIFFDKNKIFENRDPVSNYGNSDYESTLLERNFITIKNENDTIFAKDSNSKIINLNLNNANDDFQNKNNEINYRLENPILSNERRSCFSSNLHVNNSLDNLNLNNISKNNIYPKSSYFGGIFYIEDSDKLIFDINRCDLIFIFMRTFFSVLSVSLAMISWQHLSISNFFSVFYVYPAIVILLSFFILNEKIRKIDYICLISCFIGMIFIIRPEFIFHNVIEDLNRKFYAIVIFSALFKSFEDIIIRNIGKDIHFLIIPFVYSIIGIILYPLVLILAADHIGKVNLGNIDILLLVLIALSNFAFQSFYALGIQNEKAGRASMIYYLQIPLMFLFDLIIFNKKFVFYDLLGTFIIFGFNFGNSALIVVERSNNWKRYKDINK